MAFYAGGQSENWIQELNQGDSYSFTVSMKDPDTLEVIPFVNGDTVRYTVRTSYESTEVSLQEVVTSFTTEGKAEFIISSSETDLALGEYVYDIEVTKADETVTTIIPDSKTVCILPTYRVCPQVTKAV